MLAARLLAEGVRPDGAVGILLDRSLLLPVAVLGVLRAGGSCLPLDSSYPADRLARMVADARPTVVLVGPSTRPDVPGNSAVVVLDVEDATAGTAPPSAAPVPVLPDHLAYVIYTSGSTGTPKGVAMTHAALLNLVGWHQRCLPCPGRTLQFAPLGFDVSFQEMLTTWAVGAELVLVPEALRHDAAALVDLIVEQGIARLFLPAVVLGQLAATFAERGHPPCALRQVIVAGEQLQVTQAVAAWLGRLPGCELQNHYGPSETHVVTAHGLSGPPSDWPRLPPIGRPIAGTHIYVLDEALELVAPGMCGMVYVAGQALAQATSDGRG